MSKKSKKDEYEKFAGDFKTEDELEEELDEEGLDLKDVEKKHFEDEQEPELKEE
jgi:hypothetical protein